MKNKLTDLNNHLFEALERINSDDLKGDDLRDELARSRAVSNVSREIIHNARLVLDAEKFAAGGDSLPTDKELPDMLTTKPKLPQLGVIDGKKKQG